MKAYQKHKTTGGERTVHHDTPRSEARAMRRQGVTTARQQKRHKIAAREYARAETQSGAPDAADEDCTDLG